MTRVLLVCLGNICRSPTAQGVLEAKAAARGISLSADSAGTSGWHDGDPPYGPSIASAAARGYDLSRQRSRKVSLSDFTDFDIILGMDDKNMSDLKALAPKTSTAQLALMTDWLPDTDGGAPVPDPYYTRDFDGALDLIERAADAFLDHLAP